MGLIITSKFIRFGDLNMPFFNALPYDRCVSFFEASSVCTFVANESRDVDDIVEGILRVSFSRLRLWLPSLSIIKVKNLRSSKDRSTHHI